MNLLVFEEYILRTLLYYEIFDHPLSLDELFQLFPKNSLSKSQFLNNIVALVREKKVMESNGMYQASGNAKDLSEIRNKRELYARKQLVIAKIMKHVIRRFPFVRGVFLSGELSKHVATQKSDIDFVIVTSQKRLWVCRTLLILFKKTFLFNSKKYFCLNYFVSENNLEVEEHNYYTATEIAHLKPLSNFPLFLKFMNTNSWIKTYFPNYSLYEFVKEEPSEYSSWLQEVLEIFFPIRLTDSLDIFLMNTMKKIWANRYPQYDERARERTFKSTNNESRAFVGNFGEKILTLYQTKLELHNLS